MENGSSGLQDRAFEALKKMKKVGIIVSIIIILLGLCLFIKPIATGAVMVWILVIGVLVNGIQKLVAYFQMPKGGRDNFLLASAIILILISIIIIARGVNFEFAITTDIEVCIAIMIAITCIFTGIGRICGSGVVKRAGGSQALAILGGVLDLVCGIIIMCAPLFGLLTIAIVFGIYLIITGVSLLVRILSIR